MQLLHYNHDQSKLQMISTYKVDTDIMGGGMNALGAPNSQGRELKEVLYISYDTELQTMVIVFAQNYALTVNIERCGKSEHTAHECQCVEHLEITNFTIAEIDSKYALDFKRVVTNHPRKMGP